MAVNPSNISTSWKLSPDGISVNVSPVRTENGVVDLPIGTDDPKRVAAYFISVHDGVSNVGLYIWGKAKDRHLIEHMCNVLFTSMASANPISLDAGIRAFASEAERLRLGWWPETKIAAEAFQRTPLWQVVTIPEAAEPSEQTFTRDYAGWPNSAQVREKARNLIEQKVALSA